MWEDALNSNGLKLSQLSGFDTKLKLKPLTEVSSESFPVTTKK